MTELHILLISVSWASAWSGRGVRPQHIVGVFFLNRDTPRVEFHITCRQTGNSNFCSYDSTVSAFFISPAFVCALLLLCCSEALQGTVVGWWYTWVEEQTRQRIKRTARERTELKERSQICALDKLSPTQLLLYNRLYLHFQKVKRTDSTSYKTCVFPCSFSRSFSKLFLLCSKAALQGHVSVCWKHYKSDKLLCQPGEVVYPTFKCIWWGWEGAWLAGCVPVRGGLLAFQKNLCPVHYSLDLPMTFAIRPSC